MLRSLLSRRLSAAWQTKSQEIVAPLSLRLSALNLSTEATVSSKTRAFPSNLKIDPRSSFAPLDQSTSAPIRVDEEDDDKDDEKSPKVASDSLQKEDYPDDDDDDDDQEADFVWEEPPATPVIPLPDRLHASIYNFGIDTSSEDPEEAGTIWLNESVFGLDPIRVDLLKRAVDYHRAKKRGRRKAHTKTIGEIRGSGRKMRPQKGQGTARAGHRFAAHWRGGAKAHGPKKETNYGNIKMNKKVRKLAVRHVLSQKLKEQNLILVNQFHSLPSHKTKVLAQYLQPFGIAGRHGTTALLLDSYWPEYNPDKKNEGEEGAQATSFRGVPINLHVAAGNLYKIKIGNQLRDLNVYDVLKHEKLVMTVEALTALEARLKDE